MQDTHLGTSCKTKNSITKKNNFTNFLAVLTVIFCFCFCYRYQKNSNEPKKENINELCKNV